MQTVYDACCGGTLSATTVALAAEDCRDEVISEFMATAPAGTVLTSTIDVEWLATQFPSEVCVQSMRAGEQWPARSCVADTVILVVWVLHIQRPVCPMPGC